MAQRLEVCVEADRRQRGNHQEFADGLHDGGDLGGQEVQACQCGHGEEAQDKPRENGADANRHAVCIGVFFSLDAQIDRRKHQHGGDDGERPGQLDHGCEVAGSLAEGVAGGDDAGGVVHSRSRPEAEGRVGKAHPSAEQGKDDDHHGVKQEGRGHAVGNVHIVRLDDGRDGGNGGAAANAGSGIDEAAGLPAEPQRLADQSAKPEAGRERKDHDRQGELSDRQDRADVQTRAQKNDRELQQLLGRELDAGSGGAVGLPDRVYGHADEQGDDGGADDMQPRGLFKPLQPFCGKRDRERQQRSGDQREHLAHDVSFQPSSFYAFRQHRTTASTRFGGSFPPILRFEKLEIHTVFLRFSNLDLTKNLSPNLLVELCGVAFILSPFYDKINA